MPKVTLTPNIDRGLAAIVSIVATVRATGVGDDPAEEADIDAALAWINACLRARARNKEGT